MLNQNATFEDDIATIRGVIMSRSLEGNAQGTQLINELVRGCHIHQAWRPIALVNLGIIRSPEFVQSWEQALDAAWVPNAPDHSGDEPTTSNSALGSADPASGASVLRTPEQVAHPPAVSFSLGSAGPPIAVFQEPEDIYARRGLLIPQWILGVGGSSPGDVPCAVRMRPTTLLKNPSRSMSQLSGTIRSYQSDSALHQLSLVFLIWFGIV